MKNDQYNDLVTKVCWSDMNPRQNTRKNYILFIYGFEGQDYN